MKSKFKALNFEGVELLSNEEKARVKGGYFQMGSGSVGAGNNNKTVSCNAYSVPGFAEKKWTASVPYHQFSSFGAMQQACFSTLTGGYVTQLAVECI